MKTRNKIVIGLLVLVAIPPVVSILFIMEESKVAAAYRSYTESVLVEKYLLECRRQEKNYFLRGDIESFELFLAHCDSISITLARLSQDLDNNELREYVNLLQKDVGEYSIALKQIIRSTTETRMTRENISMMHMCTELAGKCHDHAGSLSDLTYQQVLEADRRMQSFPFVILIGGGVLAVICAAYILHLANPPLRLLEGSTEDRP